MPKRVLVVGDVIDDVIVVPHGPIRPDTDTVSDIRSTPGGSAANTASWLGHLGLDVEFVGMVAAADVARHSVVFEGYGVTPRLQGHPTLPTGAIVILVEGDRRAMLTERGANDALDLAAIDVTGFDALHLTGYSLFTRESSTDVTALIERARAAGLQVCVDPGSAGFLQDYGTERFLTAIASATILVPNAEEAQVLGTLDFPIVAITADRSGVTVNGEHVEAVAADIVDPTGAGDAFTAGFLAALLDGDDPRTAAGRGAALASIAVSSLGARPHV
jgi:sugar/nucleoside kinase (ribokinase family)